MANKSDLSILSSKSPIQRDSRQLRASAHDIPLFIIGGPAGCGKSTIAQYLADTTHFPFIEGDALHPPENITKMSAGQPLVDADRWGWLDTIISASCELEMERQPAGIVVTCSSLKRAYRDRMRRRVDEARERGSCLCEWFVFCQLSLEESTRRVMNRQGHYMKREMVASQFTDLELPDANVERRVYVLNVERPAEEVKRDAIEFATRCISSLSSGEEISDNTVTN
jgi:gluconokinase